MGIGEQKTPKAFINACNVFIYTEILTPKELILKDKAASTNTATKEEKQKRTDPIPLLKEAFEMAAREDGWAHLGTVGLYLRQLDPGFDPRTYGYKQLSQLIKANSNIFELRDQQDETGPTIFYIKLKE